MQQVERAYGLQSVSEQALSSLELSAKETVPKQEKESLWDKSETMEERRRQGVQDWLAYRKKQKEAARAAAQEREATRARDQRRTQDTGRDIGDDPDTV